MVSKKLALGLLASLCLAQAAAASMHLTFEDTFDSVELDPAKWQPHYPTAIFNVSVRPAAFVLDAFDFLPTDGLRLRADKRPSETGKAYSSGAMTTRGLFSQTYGYFEMRAKLPKGNGLWPAFWLLPAGAGGEGAQEIDVFEYLGKSPTKIYQTYHNSANTQQQIAYTNGTDFSQAYHVYAVSWRPEAVIFYVDGVQTLSVPNTTLAVPTTPFYLLVDTDMGATTSSWPGTPDATTHFPAYYDIDYVRAWQYDDLPATTPLAIEFGKTLPAQQNLFPGQTLPVNTILKAGNAAVPGEKVRIYIDKYDGTALTGASPDAYTAYGTIPANTTLPVSVNWTLPTTIAPGLYTVKIQTAYPGRGSPAAWGIGTEFLVKQPGTLDLSALTYTPVSGQDAAGSLVDVLNQGQRARFRGNVWKAATINYTVTAKTVLEFDFDATNAAEIYGIGLFPTAAYDYATLNTYLYQLAGSEVLGKQTYKNYPQPDGGIKHYTVNVGANYQGPVTRLVFAGDADASANADCTFRNVRLYEGP